MMNKTFFYFCICLCVVSVVLFVPLNLQAKMVSYVDDHGRRYYVNPDIGKVPPEFADQIPAEVVSMGQGGTVPEGESAYDESSYAPAVVDEPIRDDYDDVQVVDEQTNNNQTSGRVSKDTASKTKIQDSVTVPQPKVKAENPDNRGQGVGLKGYERHQVVDSRGKKVDPGKISVAVAYYTTTDCRGCLNLEMELKARKIGFLRYDLTHARDKKVHLDRLYPLGYELPITEINGVAHVQGISVSKVVKKILEISGAKSIKDIKWVK